MANANDPIFQVDASQLIAKLHLAAQQQADPDGKQYVINTGIENPQAKGDPNKLGNTTFNLEGTGKYQVGFCRTDYWYYPQINLEGDKKLTDLSKAADKANEQLTKEPTAENKQALVDSQIEILDYVFDTYIFVAAEKEKEVKEFLDAYKEAQKNKKLDLKDEKSKDGETPDEETPEDDKTKQPDKNEEPQFESPCVNALKLMTPAYKKENEARLQQKNENIENWRSTTFKNAVKPYFEAFVGKDQAGKVQEAELVPIFITMDIKEIKDSVAASSKVNKGVIEGIPDKEIEEFEKQHSSKNPSEKISPLLCFVTGFEVEIETM